ncbi:MAG TPA: sugar ABC transporter substrate-binding protein [Candidatus Methylomirabilis sp.]|nr:sugar ABC transporter substrate-binding protein [Candidatus Methylomirabilis sp.]HSC70780.1 sugar ABC transporter substrate-binding protein [Candidatus Methylomirabilis sp.]
MRRRAAIAGMTLVLALAVSAWGGERKVVRVWHTETEPQTVAAMQEIANDFEKLHPDISIRQEGLAWGDLEAKLTAALAAGAPPETSHGQAFTCASFYHKGLLRDQEDIANAIGKENIFEAVRNLCRFDGKYYGITHSPNTNLLIYRKDLFKQKGLKPPETWDDFIKVAQAMMERDATGRVTRYGLSLPGVPLFVNILVAELTKANGGRLFDGTTGRPTFTEKQVVEVLDFYKKMNDTILPPGWLGHGYLDTFTNLATGKVAMVYQGHGRSAGYIEKYAPQGTGTPEYFGVMRKPHGPSGKETAAQVDAEPWMIFKNSKYPEEAAEFLKFFFQEKNYIKYLHTVPIHLLPTLKSVRNSPAYQSNEMYRRWKEWVEMDYYYFERDLAKPTLVVDWNDLKLPFLLEIFGSNILPDMVTDAVKGMPSAQAAAKAQARAEELITKLGSKRW